MPMGMTPPNLNRRTRNLLLRAMSIHAIALADSRPKRRAVLPPRKHQNLSTAFMPFGLATGCGETAAAAFIVASAASLSAGGRSGEAALDRDPR
jgi:hypothetical protein